MSSFPSIEQCSVLLFYLPNKQEGLFCSSVPLGAPPVPEWAQQEVIVHSLSCGVLESSFPLSDQSGVSSHLMESMR